AEAAEAAEPPAQAEMPVDAEVVEAVAANAAEVEGEAEAVAALANTTDETTEATGTVDTTEATSEEPTEAPHSRRRRRGRGGGGGGGANAAANGDAPDGETPEPVIRGTSGGGSESAMLTRAVERLTRQLEQQSRQ